MSTFHKISKNIKDTEIIAKEFLEELLKSKKSVATIVGLSGDLGTGKTTFTQHIAKALGVKTKVNSPTFVIMKRYSIKKGNWKNLFHLDAYRLKNEKELLHLGWEDIVSNSESIIFIEWPEMIKKAMPKKHHKVSIKHLPAPDRVVGQAGSKEGHRKFQFKMLQ